MLDTMLRNIVGEILGRIVSVLVEADWKWVFGPNRFWVSVLDRWISRKLFILGDQFLFHLIWSCCLGAIMRRITSVGFCA